MQAIPNFKTNLVNDNDSLTARIICDTPSSDFEYAFYLKNGSDKIGTRWYEASEIAIFNRPKEAGRYHVVGFARKRGTKNTVRTTSNIVTLGQMAPKASARGVFARLGPAQKLSLDELPSFLTSKEEARLDLTVGGHEFPCCFNKGTGEHLFVLLAGAVGDRKVAEIPVFNRFTWAADFPGAVLSVSDPTLAQDDKIRLAWYFGNKEHDLTPDLIGLTRATAASLGISQDKIVFYGSSGGGFAALMLAAKMGNGATAIAINPQTCCTEYVDNSVQEFLRVCLGGMSKEQALAKYPDRISTIEAWKQASASSARCLIVQNKLDAHHYRGHYLPFAEQFKVQEDMDTANARMAAITMSDERGHVGEPRQMLSLILEKALQLRFTLCE